MRTLVSLFLIAVGVVVVLTGVFATVFLFKLIVGAVFVAAMTFISKIVVTLIGISIGFLFLELIIILSRKYLYETNKGRTTPSNNGPHQSDRR